MTCFCGHVQDEHQHHGENPDAPNASACTIDDCDCLMFEVEPDDE